MPIGNGCAARLFKHAVILGTFLFAAAVAIAPLAAGAHGTGKVKSLAKGPKTDHYDAGVATAWFDLLYSLVRAEKLSPPVASRRIGYAGVTLYEAVVPGIKHHRSLGGQLNGLGALPSVEKKQYHWPSVANAALARVMRGLFAGASPASLAAIDALEAQITSQLGDAKGPKLKAKDLPRSLEFGHDVADAILAWSAADGLLANNNCPYTPPVGPGLWVPTPPAFAAPLQPCWGQLRPFVLSSGDECAPPVHTTFSTDPASAFYAQGLEVYTTVNHLTPEQEAIARFWADNPAQTGTPPGHWISIVGQISRQYGLELDDAAQAYARVGIAVADGFISCWNTKYVYNLLRPITYIRDNIDPSWMPLLPTPGFPEYTSGHSVQSSAAATVLTDLLGDLSFTDETHAALGLTARSFDSFNEAADEAAISRLYGGIHYRDAIDFGVSQGRCIGDTLLHRVRFK